MVSTKDLTSLKDSLLKIDGSTSNSVTRPDVTSSTHREFSNIPGCTSVPISGVSSSMVFTCSMSSKLCLIIYFTFFVNSTLSIFKSLYYNFLSTILAMLPANANELDRHVLTVVLGLFLFTYIDFGDDRAS